MRKSEDSKNRRGRGRGLRLRVPYLQSGHSSVADVGDVGDVLHAPKAPGKVLGRYGGTDCYTRIESDGVPRGQVGVGKGLL